MSNSFFNDPYFYRAKQYVINTITQEEVILFNSGKIRKIYSSFEEMLLDNMQYYSRFIRTILWLYENILVQDGKLITRESKVKYTQPMSCTKFYYIVMCNNDFTRDEIFYGYPQLGNSRGQSFQGLFRKLIEIGSFAFNVTYTTERYKTKSFTFAFNRDITNSEYLYKICDRSKDDILFIERNSLLVDIGSLIKISELNEKIYNILNNLTTKINYTINIKPNRIEYYSQYGRYYLKIDDNKVTKELTATSKDIVHFDNVVNDKIRLILKYNNNIISHQLSSIRILCRYMLSEYRNRFIAIKTYPGSTEYSKITLKQVWNMFQMYETKYNDSGKEIYHIKLKTLLPRKLCEYLLDNGYYMYGSMDNIEELVELSNINVGQDVLDYYEVYMNNRYMSSQYKLQVLNIQTEKIINFITRVR